MLHKCMYCENLTQNPKFCSKQCSNKYWGKQHLGKNNPNYGNHKLAGKNHPNYKDAYIEKKCLECGRKFKAYLSQVGKFCSRECYQNSKQFQDMERGFNRLHTLEERINLSCNKLGITREEWNGFVGDRENQSGFRKLVYDRDNYTCQMCGDDKGGNLNAHHILPYSKFKCLRAEVDNGITLCKECHKMIHKKGYDDAIQLMVAVRGLGFFRKLVKM